MNKNNNLSELLKSYGTIFAGIVIVITFSFFRPDAFFTYGNLINITRQIALLVIIALGATLVMSVDEFDLSIGALASLGGVIAAKMAVAGMSIILCFITPVFICFIIGLINGWIVTKFKVLSFITTLAMSTILAGFTFWFTGGATIFQNIPRSFTIVGSKNVLRIPILSIIMILLVLLFWFIMRHTTFGRKLYAIGGNVAASEVSGINVKKYKNLAFALCAALSALAGVLMASRLGSAHPTGGDGLFLQSYAAVFIGRTVFKEGIPNIWGTFAGAAILGILANGLTIMQVPTFMQDLLTGCIIILAVIVQKIGNGDSK
ncbi:ABC transporter permease [Clostridium magnum]|uniref:Ribose transport system permease protein RbsC n=1 Tax=Clostridium magnum DSM 2767 TaxID=1121326 RepID=A0A162RT11_9CLOT|nr:ABC transporter permease [Clostridium magnum]KZL90337.1 ribose transport system permease protein RbsC [Clostridium magnum DSM 2767]SHH82428.1 ribose transport system permease protein [Clostridium magnum DSM 2767]